ncbi:MAG: hypothetical protein HRU25_16945 [Psychrobium sp.]|nr:hypothetical protein [Psychrobium sp.]
MRAINRTICAEEQKHLDKMQRERNQKSMDEAAQLDHSQGVLTTKGGVTWVDAIMVAELNLGGSVNLDKVLAEFTDSSVKVIKGHQHTMYKLDDVEEGIENYKTWLAATNRPLEYRD